MDKRFKDLAAGVGSDGHLAKAVKDLAAADLAGGTGRVCQGAGRGSEGFQRSGQRRHVDQKRTMKMSEDRIEEVTSKVAQVAATCRSRRAEPGTSWKPSSSSGSERAMARLGVPNQREIATLKKRG